MQQISRMEGGSFWQFDIRGALIEGLANSTGANTGSGAYMAGEILGIPIPASGLRAQ